MNKDFRDAIDTCDFVYVEGHVCINNEKYIYSSDRGVGLTSYALSHMDECCLVFDKGYSYESKYQVNKFYTQMMYKIPGQVTAQEFSFEMNDHNSILLEKMKN